MNLSNLSLPLPVEYIDFRVQSINKGGYATILAYKDARVDMLRLDDVCGPENWQRRHCRDNANCIIEIWCDKKEQWISKEDTGTESNSEKEKGLASDSFKRAGFNWGIGRELYEYPDISIKLNNNEFELYDVEVRGKKVKKARATWDLKLKEWDWYSEFDIKKREITFLAARDEKEALRFKWGERDVGEEPSLIPFAEIR